MMGDEAAPDGYRWTFAPVCGYPQSGISALGCLQCGVLVVDPTLHDHVHAPPPVPRAKRVARWITGRLNRKGG